jgi:RNA polymerase sigma-70 factor (ECF subfamily)
VGIDETDFERLYRAEWDSVVNYLRYRSGSDEADDMAAEVFTRAWIARDQYDASRGTAAAWLWGIARNAGSRRRRTEVASNALPPNTPADTDVQEDAIRAALFAPIASALNALDPDDREILALRFGAGHTNRAIGDLLRIEEGTAAVRVHRAIKRLRALLPEQSHD